jgi:hypothetical protein
MTADLTKLTLEYGDFGLPPHTSILFPHLSRLSLIGGVRLIAEDEDYRNFLSGSTFPSLKHLAIDMNAKIGYECETYFKGIASRLETLALADTEGGGRVSPLEVLQSVSHSRSLKHLSLNLCEQFEEILFEAGLGLELDSVHVAASIFSYYESSGLDRLVAVARGQKETVKAKRVVLYGSRKEVERATSGDKSSLDVFEWREDQIAPALVDFDGK